jgi:hypothetical protein
MFTELCISGLILQRVVSSQNHVYIVQDFSSWNLVYKHGFFNTKKSVLQQHFYLLLELYLV